MLFFVVAIAFLAAANAAHVTTVQEVNGLIDHTIKKIIDHRKIDVPGLEVAAEVTNFQNLRRSGNCAKTAAPLTFECHAIATEAVFAAEGEKMDVTLHITFTVVVNTEGQLVKFDLEEVDVVPNGEFAEYYFSLKKLFKKAKAAVVKAVKGKAKDSTTQVQKEVGTTVFGTVIGG